MSPAPSPGRGVLTGIVANIAGARKVPLLARYIREYEPDFVVVIEAYNARAWLRDNFPRYRNKHAGPAQGAEAAGIAILVRKRIPIDWDKVLRMTERWWGPFTGRVRDPRRPRKMRLRKGGTFWPLYAAHFPPGGPSGGSRTGGKNRAAWMESANHATRWLRNRVRGIVVGDLNGTRIEVRRHIANPADASLTSVGKVTHSIVRGARRVDGERLDSPDGMHGWGLFRYHPSRK